MNWFTILKNKWGKKNNVDNNENIEIVEQILWKKLKLVGREIVIEQLQINEYWIEDYE